VTEYFHPEEASTAQLLTELSTGLAERFDVSVVTAYPNYHCDDRSRAVPQETSYDGVDVFRVRATTFDKDSLPLRVINWLSFTALAFFRLLRRSRRDEIILALSNPPILPLAIAVVKRLTGGKFVYLIYDIYPDMPIQLGMISEGGPVATIWESTMRWVYKEADCVVVLGESMRRTVTEKMRDEDSFDEEKIEVIPNWEDPEFIQPLDKQNNGFAQRNGTQNDFTLLYSGNIGRFHDLETAVDAIGALEARGRSDIQLLIIGEGAKKPELRNQVQEQGIDNVKFLPFQPKKRLPESLTCGDASLVTVKRGVEGLCVSSKLYSSLAAGQPILALVSEEDEVAHVVDGCDCGVRVDQGSAEQVADTLEHWADNREEAARLGRRARECFEQRYTKEDAVGAYRQLFSRLSG
jgi:glycosyltransferase involved in cell wall biosynthesis